VIGDEHFSEISPLGDATVAGAIAPKNVNHRMSTERAMSLRLIDEHEKRLVVVQRDFFIPAKIY